MSDILKFDFQKQEELRFSEVNYLNYTKKDTILHVATTFFKKKKREELRFSEVNYLNYTKKTQFYMWQTTFSLKQGETKTSHGPIPHPLTKIL